MRVKLLVVEDDPGVAASLSDYLSAEGFGVELASSAEEARQAGPTSFDLVVLDWMLPDTQGIDLLREWRACGVETPILMLTARADLVDRVLGLELGANDYVTKPFEARELLARVRVQLRQRRVPKAVAAPTIGVGLLQITLPTREVRYGERTLDLTRQEYALLLLLAENPDRVFSRAEILRLAWGYDAMPSTRTVDTHVLQLRQKTSPRLLETVRGIGYRLRSEEN